jgi:hypothetical protein
VRLLIFKVININVKKIDSIKIKKKSANNCWLRIVAEQKGNGLLRTANNAAWQMQPLWKFATYVFASACQYLAWIKLKKQ